MENVETIKEEIFYAFQIFLSYCQNFRGGSFGQMEAVDVGDVGDVAKWRQKLI